ncbi:MAG: hypothetical protein JJE42_16590 [Burkholderiales bacterium]|nr:hypothetical protein [Burkholderiales bacterium]
MLRLGGLGGSDAHARRLSCAGRARIQIHRPVRGERLQVSCTGNLPGKHRRRRTLGPRRQH